MASRTIRRINPEHVRPGQGALMVNLLVTHGAVVVLRREMALDTVQIDRAAEPAAMAFGPRVLMALET